MNEKEVIEKGIVSVDRNGDVWLNSNGKKLKPKNKNFANNKSRSKRASISFV